MRPPPPEQSENQLVRLNHEGDRVAREPLEAFFEACGGAQPISLAVRRIESRRADETYTFQQPFVVIGSCPECDLVMPDQSVNYRHYYLQLVGGQWHFKNLARISRTKAGQGHAASGVFDSGTDLKVGSHFLKRVITPSQGRTRLDVESSPESDFDLPSFTLDVVSRRRGSVDLPPTEFNAPITLIGTSKHCDLSLDDTSVSRVHASLVLTPGGLWVVDLLGRAGLIIDGRREVWSRVHDGTVLQVGRASIRVRLGGPRPRSIGRVGRRASRAEYVPEVPAPQAPAQVYGGLSENAVLALVGEMREMQNQFFEHSRMQMQWMAEMLATVSETHREAARRDYARIEEITAELQAIRSQLANSPGAPASEPAVRGGVLRLVEFPQDEVGSSPPEPVGQEPAAAVPQTNWHVSPARPELPAFSPVEMPPPAPIELAVAAPLAVAEQLTPAAPPPAPQFAPAPMPESAEQRPVPASPAADNPQRQVQPTPRPEPDPSVSPSSVEAHVWLTQRMAALSQEQNSLWRRLMNTLTGK
jgi:hypothetical protein